MGPNSTGSTFDNQLRLDDVKAEADRKARQNQREQGLPALPEYEPLTADNESEAQPPLTSPPSSSHNRRFAALTAWHITHTPFMLPASALPHLENYRSAHVDPDTFGVEAHSPPFSEHPHATS
ncbi:hypothetical protein BGW80DRAFT_1456001 [Lactifluus volemus]|nr:hypothetical protein BGW80DRAFT_1456001 [Lactifluus volemus]